MADLRFCIFSVVSAVSVILFISFSLIDTELFQSSNYQTSNEIGTNELAVSELNENKQSELELRNNAVRFDSMRNSENEESSTPENVKRKPLMLAWTKFHSGHMIHVLALLRRCPYKCDYTKDMKRLNESDAVIYHGGDLKSKYRLQQYSPPGQVKVLFMRESPGRDTARFYEGWNAIPLSFFNITMTYYKKSTYWEHYNYFDLAGPKDEDVYPQDYVDEVVANKTEGAYFAASHCGAESKRERLVAELSKYTNVTKYGKCGRSLRCDRKCEVDVLKKSHFYLALENSVCQEYITEKFFKLKRLIVPITFKRSLVEHLAPPNSFIAVDDFCSVEQLGNYLNYSMENKEEYRKYFEWTKYYRFGTPERSLCNLCRDLTHGNVTTSDYSTEYTNIKSFMNTNHCDRGFTGKMMRNRCNENSTIPNINSLGISFN